MEDIIDIIVTETTNLIEITSQSTDEVIDVNIIDNREDVTLNVTPTVVEININSLTGNFGVAWGEITGTLSNQTDLNTALGLKADLVAGKVPSSQLPSYVDDVVEVANYAALPATGETGKIYVTIDTNYIYRWTGSVYVEIKDSSAVWGAITGTLSFQNDLQSALNAKFDDPTGDTTQYIAGDGSLITFPVAGQSGTLVREVRNTTGATLTKGTIVYISGATGNKPTVSKAIATGDSTSAQTFGMCQSNIGNNSNGYVVCVGDITGLDTSALTEGVQLYLSSTTAGAYTTTKQVAPAHLVYIGVVTRSHPTQGQIEVKIQNGYELDEIHDVAISSVANNQGIFYESSTSLWKNKSIATVLGYTPEQPLTFNTPLSRSTNTVSIPAATSSANGYLTSTDWTTFNGKQTALNGTGFVKASGTTISYDNTSYLPTTGGTIGGQLNISNTGAATALYIDQTNGSYHAASFNNSGGGSALYIGGTATFVGTINCTSSITGSSIVKSGGTSSQFLKADGSVDSNTYLTTSSASSTYLAKTGGTLTNAFSNNLNISQTSGSTTLGHLGQFSDSLYISNNYFYNGNQSYDDTSKANSSIEMGTGFIYLKTGAANTTPGIKLTIAQSGAATFSNSVTAGGNLGTSQAYISNIYPSLIFTTNAAIVTTGANPIDFRPNDVIAMRITSDRNIGIGTTSPIDKVTIYAAGQYPTSIGDNVYLGIANDGGAAGNMHQIGFGYNSGATGNFYPAIIGGISSSSTGQTKEDIFFATRDVTTGTTRPTERMRITSAGKVLIGTTSPTAIGGDNLYIYGTGNVFTSQTTSGASTWSMIAWNSATSGNNGFIEFGTETGYAARGSITYNRGAGLTVFNTTSDYRIKTDIKEFNALNIITKLKPKEYKIIDATNKSIGFIAHELQEFFPQAVCGDKDGERMQQVDYSQLTGLLTKGVQEVDSKIVQLEKKIEILETEIETLKNK